TDFLLTRRRVTNKSHPDPPQNHKQISPSPWEGREERAGRVFPFGLVPREMSSATAFDFAYSMLLPNASFIIPEEPEEWD
ncbi:MAG: hypothetical protein ACKN81_05040, partial [Pirellulaceae bacterium]